VSIVCSTNSIIKKTEDATKAEEIMRKKNTKWAPWKHENLILSSTEFMQHQAGVKEAVITHYGKPVMYVQIADKIRGHTTSKAVLMVTGLRLVRDRVLSGEIVTVTNWGEPEWLFTEYISKGCYEKL